MWLKYLGYSAADLAYDPCCGYGYEEGKEEGAPIAEVEGCEWNDDVTYVYEVYLEGYASHEGEGSIDDLQPWCASQDVKEVAHEEYGGDGKGYVEHPLCVEREFVVAYLFKPHGCCETDDKEKPYEEP